MLLNGASPPPPVATAARFEALACRNLHTKQYSLPASIDSSSFFTAKICELINEPARQSLGESQSSQQTVLRSAAPQQSKAANTMGATAPKQEKTGAAHNGCCFTFLLGKSALEMHVFAGYK